MVRTKTMLSHLRYLHTNFIAICSFQRSLILSLMHCPHFSDGSCLDSAVHKGASNDKGVLKLRQVTGVGVRMMLA